MNSEEPELRSTWVAIIVLAACVLSCVLLAVLANRVQTSFGEVEVSNTSFVNEHGREVRGKLFIPEERTQGERLPGVVFIHGYQSLRETGDGICIELSRRGFVALTIDAIGRGNSDVPEGMPGDPEFDETFGGKAAVAYLRSLPIVDPARVGVSGHSLGGGMAYRVALENKHVRGLVIIGTAYNEEASPSHPKNMLMAIGKYDEHRERMTNTRDIEAEWMGSKETASAFGRDDAEIGKTYGDFSDGTARRVIVPPITHEVEAHDKEVVAETVAWMAKSLNHDIHLAPTDQIWEIKELSTLGMMAAGFAALFPLAFLLIQLRPFRGLQRKRKWTYTCPGADLKKLVLINGLLMWLYLPAALILFGVHKYVVPIDGVFPLMIPNVVLGWLLGSNAIGYGLMKRWAKKHPTGKDALFDDMGIGLRAAPLAKTALLAGILFGFIYGLEVLLETLWIVDFRYIFAFANDLTPRRWGMFALYLPMFAIGFTWMGYFLHGRLRLAERKTRTGTFFHWSIVNLLTMILPMVLLLAVQYVPLFAAGFIPLVGPGSMFVLLVINIFHILGVLVVVVLVSTWLYILTGRPYAGALLNAAIVTWMFASSQVISPIPV